jgi:hypothetical protein
MVNTKSCASIVTSKIRLQKHTMSKTPQIHKIVKILFTIDCPFQPQNQTYRNLICNLKT